MKTDKHGRIVKASMDEMINPDIFSKEILKSITYSIDKESNKRIANLVKIYEEQYPAGDEDSRVQATLYNLDMIQDVLPLYLIGRNASVINELYSWLEHTALICIPKLLSKNERSQEIISEFIDRKTLTELLPALERLMILNAEEITLLTRLKRIRDGIAHKNIELIKKHVTFGKNIETHDISKTVDELDTAMFIIKVMHLRTKIQHYAFTPIELPNN